MSISTTHSFPPCAYRCAARTASCALRPGRNPYLCSLNCGSKIGVNTCNNNCCRNRSWTVGIPSIRVPPLGLGISTRMTIGAGIVAVYAALTATELWTERRRSMRRRWPTLVVPVMHGFVLMLPIMLGTLLHPHDGKFAASIWVTGFTVELVLYAVGTVFVIFMLVSERAVSAHRNAASMDPLTQMFNRRGFSEISSRLIDREAKAGRPVTALIFDIDHFKSINDRFGHPAGDEILKLFAAIVINNLRITDHSGRIGGEEFAALLPCPLEEGVLVAERVREVFAA